MTFLSFVLVVLAAGFIAFGSFFVGLTFSVDKLFELIATANLKLILVPFSAFCISLTGSLFWALSRKGIYSYAYGWCLYMFLLLLFGVLISIVFEGYALGVNGIFGLALMVIGILFIRPA